MSKLNWMMKACPVLLLWAAAALTSSGQTFRSLVSFDGTNGVYPQDVSLVQGLDGRFYGTTYEDGAYGGGTVFKITPDGMLTTLYNFCSQVNCTDGALPRAGLVLGNDGHLYGTAWDRGTVSDNCIYGNAGCGTVFKITPQGEVTILHSFCEAGVDDGALPYAAMLQATDGYLYGTTANTCGGGQGTIFKMTPGGLLTILDTFIGGSEGVPVSAPVQTTDGKIYGTTYYGGANLGGQVFQITPTGTFTTLYSFCSQIINNLCADGENPTGLIQGSDGNLYGATYSGGTSTNCPDFGCGTVFKLTPSGTLTSLYSFNSTDGSKPFGPVIQATDGNLYGTASTGGGTTECEEGCGTIFEITRSGTFTTLHTFSSTDGANPEGGVLQATNGSFYGTTEYGGTNGFGGEGTVFSLSVGLAPFVKTQPASSAVGAAVYILGTDLSGATSVTFNGTPAVFTVNSHSLITTTVPAGATTGTVQVVTPSGTLSSNVPFRVRP
jgi:uncharacterized repeat protein (TIGR03803 family)